MIQIADLKPGFLYRIKARNFSLGVWNPELHAGKGVFIGIRTKFGDRYLFGELHYDADSHFGTTTPIEEICKCPLSDIRMDLGTVCGHCHYEFNLDIPVGYVNYPDGPKKEVHKHKDGTEWEASYPGRWMHLEGESCEKPHGLMLSNNALFNWLEWAEKEFAKLKEEK